VVSVVVVNEGTGAMLGAEFEGAGEPWVPTWVEEHAVKSTVAATPIDHTARSAADDRGVPAERGATTIRRSYTHCSPIDL
jgi:hypothetical protein